MISWDVLPLGDLVDVFDSIRVPLSTAQRSTRKGPYPYYGAQGIIDYIDDFLFEGRYLLVPEDGENLNSRKLPIAYFAEGQFWVNNHAHIIRGKPQLANDVYLKHALNNIDIGGYITGAAQPKLTQANLRRIAIPAPPLREQQRIAEILGAYDDLIEINRKRMALLEEMARGLFEEWFVHFRFPGYEHEAIATDENGSLPRGWAQRELGSFLALAYGKALRAVDREPGIFPVIGSSGIVGFHVAPLVDRPGIVLGRKGNVGAVVWSPTGFWPIDTVYYVKSERPPLYLLEVLKRVSFQNTDAAVPGLNREAALRKVVTDPPIDLALRYHEFCKRPRALADQLEVSIKTLAASRDLLLPRLISGQLSVAEAERKLAQAA